MPNKDSFVSLLTIAVLSLHSIGVCQAQEIRAEEEDAYDGILDKDQLFKADVLLQQFGTGYDEQPDPMIRWNYSGRIGSFKALSLPGQDSPEVARVSSAGSARGRGAGPCSSCPRAVRAVGARRDPQ